MLDINDLIKKAIKKEIFNSSEIENKSARQVLSEIKTKFKDITNEITAEVQYKIIKKILSDRKKSIDIYASANRPDLLEREECEFNICNSLIKQLEHYLPKQMNDEEIKEKISEIILSNPNSKIGDIMKAFSNLNADKSIVSKIAKEILSK